MTRSLGARMLGPVLFLALAPSLAWSYIDPGNGAYMVQVIFTLFGAALFYIRHPVRFFHAVRNWIFKRDSKDATESREDAVPAEPGRSSTPMENTTSSGE